MLTDEQKAVKVRFQHPHHPDVAPVEVGNGSDEMLKLMNDGYSQVHDSATVTAPAPVVVTRGADVQADGVHFQDDTHQDDKKE